MTAGDPLYTSQVDPEFEGLIEDPEESPNRAVSPVRHRGDAVENAKAAWLFG